MEVNLSPSHSCKPPEPPIRSSSTLHRHSVKVAPKKPLPDVPKKTGRRRIRLFRLPKLSSDPKISSPLCVSHELHVAYDENTGEFRGMPEEWLEWLRAADISFQEREQNPELVIEVLQCYDTAKHCARRQKFIMTEDSSWENFGKITSCMCHQFMDHEHPDNNTCRKFQHNSAGSNYSASSHAFFSFLSIFVQFANGCTTTTCSTSLHSCTPKTANWDMSLKNVENNKEALPAERIKSDSRLEQKLLSGNDICFVDANVDSERESSQFCLSSLHQYFKASNECIDCESIRSYSNIFYSSMQLDEINFANPDNSEEEGGTGNKCQADVHKDQKGKDITCKDSLEEENDFMVEAEPYGVEEIEVDESERISDIIAGDVADQIAKADEINFQDHSSLINSTNWQIFCCISEAAFTSNATESASPDLQICLAQPETDEDVCLTGSTKADQNSSGVRESLEMSANIEDHTGVSKSTSSNEMKSTSGSLPSDEASSSVAIKSEKYTLQRGRTATRCNSIQNKTKRSGAHSGRQSVESLKNPSKLVAISENPSPSKNPSVECFSDNANGIQGSNPQVCLVSRHSPRCRSRIRMRDEQIIARLRTIVSQGKPSEKYETLGRIGHG
ncbi:unnamed protein product [Heterobilharzia americana]|nr:unnamed protein product [Heterobilharzia americana]